MSLTDNSTAETAKKAILARLKQGRSSTASDQERRAVIAARLKKPSRNIVPKRGQRPEQERLDLFIAMAEEASAVVTRLNAEAEIPTAVQQILSDRQLPAHIRLGLDERLQKLDWAEHKMLTAETGKAEPGDGASLSAAVAAVAETGTLALVSGPENPTSLNFLPETHIVALWRRDVVSAYEDVWDQLRAHYRDALPEGWDAAQRQNSPWPRMVNLITGPSRSADIEQTLLMGAHGPKNLHILLIDHG